MNSTESEEAGKESDNFPTKYEEHWDLKTCDDRITIVTNHRLLPH